MSHTNGLILSELRSVGITPSKSKEWYESSVQCWLWSYLGDLGIWNINPACHCHESWVQQTAYSFQKYAKEIWENSKGSYVNISTRNKGWLDTPITFPAVIECECMDESGIIDDVVQVLLILILLCKSNADGF